MIKKLILSLLVVLAVGGALVGVKLDQFRSMGEAGANMAPPPETVTAAAAARDEWEVTLSSTGTLSAVQGVTVSAEVAGKISYIDFQSGTPVAKGDVLVQLETSAEEAQLSAAEAAAALAKSNLARARDLRKNATISASELDTADAQFKQAAARVQEIRTVIAKKTIRAPFSGRLGMRLVNQGEVLREGTAVTSLQTLDPIYVNFSLPQQYLPSLSVGTPVRVTSDAAPGALFQGAITAISPEVDVTTRNVRIQATIGNSNEQLRGGMFVDVAVVQPTRDRVLAIPMTAVLFAPFGNSVFVIESQPTADGGAPEKSVKQRFIRLGRELGDFVAVVDGLAAGEEVVSSGVFKLRSGTRVVVDNTLAPKPETEPRPDDT